MGHEQQNIPEDPLGSFVPAKKDKIIELEIKKRVKGKNQNCHNHT